jgi:lysozyme family protein
MSGQGFRFAMAFVLYIEEGYIEDDAGHGPTNFGINSASHPGVDVKALTEPEAVEIYRTEYWTPLSLDDLPVGLAVAVCDGAVNHGQVTSVKLLQAALGLPADGLVGPITATAAKRPGVLDVYCSARFLRYTQHPKFALYGPTWIRRLLQCHAYCSGLPA